MIGRFLSEPATTLRRVYGRIKKENRGNMQYFAVIHPSFYLKMRVVLLRKCGGQRLRFMNKVYNYGSIIEFFNQLRSETALIQRIIGAMPH